MPNSPAAHRIKNAYLEILAERPHGPITVTEIAQRAAVNRVTFYRLYESQEAVLADILDEFDKGTGFEVPAQGSQLPSSSVARLPLEHHRKNAGMLRTILLSDMASKLESRVEKGIRDPVVKASERYGMLESFYVAGITRIICNWIRGGCSESVDEIIAFLEKAIAIFS